ncbi:MAG: MerR family transcriptional regulator [Acidobacteria bacterium]|nr:MerR family transcriptional regulator [Acidobacteriota bacterium]
MAETIAEIPDRELFKAADVCEIASVQPYVLRSWESEFPTLGFARSPGTPRVYRRDDVERVLRIKQLVYGEGLTLAGARRRLDGDAVTTDDQKPVILVADARRRLDGIKGELRSLLEMLGGQLVHAVKPRKATGAGQPTLLGIDAEVASGRKAPAETVRTGSAPAAKTPAWTSPAGNASAVKTPVAIEGEKGKAARRKA